MKSSVSVVFVVLLFPIFACAQQKTSCNQAVNDVVSDPEITTCYNGVFANFENSQDLEAQRRDTLCNAGCDWSVFRENANNIDGTCGDSGSGPQTAAKLRISPALYESLCLKNEQNVYCTLFQVDYQVPRMDHTPPNVLCVPCMDSCAQVVLGAYGQLSQRDKNQIDNLIEGGGIRNLWEPYAEKCGFNVTAAILGGSGVTDAGLRGYVAGNDTVYGTASGAAVVRVGYPGIFFTLIESLRWCRRQFPISS